MKFMDYFRLIWGNRKARVGVIILMFFVLMGIVGPLVVPPPTKTIISRTFILHPPILSNPYYWFGTNAVGGSTLAQIVYGTPSILQVVFLAGLITTAVGILMGITAGFVGGTTDLLLMGATDVALNIPSLVLTLVVASLIKNADPLTLAGILSLTSWAGLARAVRSQVLSLRSQPHIEILKILGLGRAYAIFREVIPSLGSYIAIHYIFNVEGAVYALVGLYYLGIIPYNPNNWGSMINVALSDGALFGTKAIWFFVFPTLIITIFMSSLILLSYGIDEISNPRLRVRV